MPVARLTATNVRTLGEPGRDSTFTDALLPGFVLRVRPSGVRTYAVAAWDGRSKRRVNIGRVERVSLSEARARAREILEAIQNREPVPPPPDTAPALTVARLLSRYLAAAKVRPTTLREYKRLAKTEIVPALGTKRADELDRVDVRGWIADIRSPVVARQAAAVLSRSFSWAQDRDLLETNPCLRMLPPPPAANDRVLSTAEIWALLRALERGRARHPLYAEATLLLLLTAVRRSAVLGMRRSELEDLDGPGARWVIPADRWKSGRAHVVPLSPAAAAVVRRRLAAAGGLEHLFPCTWQRLAPGRRLVVTTEDRPASWDGRWRVWLRGRVRRVVRALQRKRGEAVGGVPRWTIHGLRHTVATHLREDLEVPPDVVSLILGHTPRGLPRATPIYLRASLLPERRRALDAWASWLDGLLAPGTEPAPGPTK